MNAFLTTFAALTFSSVVVLSLMGINTLEVYVALFAIEFFVISELIPKSWQTASRRMKIIQVALIAISALIVARSIVEILT